MLHELQRPKTFAAVLGQEKTVNSLERLDSLAGRAFWIAGKSGQGKTTLARIIAGQCADGFHTQEMSAGELSVARIRQIEADGHLYPMSGNGRAYIVNEAHGLRKDVINMLLEALERVPDNAVWIFTTTVDGQTYFEDAQIDSSPLMSRCMVLSLAQRGLAKPFAVKLRSVAQSMGLDGQPVEKYVKLVNDCQGNMRECWQRIESGAMRA